MPSFNLVKSSVGLYEWVTLLSHVGLFSIHLSFLSSSTHSLRFLLQTLEMLSILPLPYSMMPSSCKSSICWLLCMVYYGVSQPSVSSSHAKIPPHCIQSSSLSSNGIEGGGNKWKDTKNLETYRGRGKSVIVWLNDTLGERLQV